MASNYPPGVSDADPEFWSWDYEPEPTDEELEELYLDSLEQQAAALPAEWTDEDIAAYEVWLAGRPMPEPKPIRIAVRIPQELEEAA